MSCKKYMIFERESEREKKLSAKLRSLYLDLDRGKMLDRQRSGSAWKPTRRRKH